MDWYKAFEDKHRGSRELIKKRLEVYLPFIQLLANVYHGCNTVDLGCGRGEWLELMKEQGFDPVGVDLDDGMLADCFELGLPVEKGEAVEYLSKLPSNSQAIVSAFHVIEHISFDQLKELVKQAMRVLMPGGLLIMETPNPENIVVATKNFYLDPTHKRPIPPALLEFMTRHFGFDRVKILRLQESKEVYENENIGIAEVLSGASPDYAVIAQKNADDEILKLTENLFNKEYGLSLEALVTRFDSRIDSLFYKTEQAESRAASAVAKAESAESRAQEAESRAQEAESKAELAQMGLKQTTMQLSAVYNSTSWRITAPLRWLKIQKILLQQRGIKQRSKAFVKKILLFIVTVINKVPIIKSLIIKISKLTGLEEKRKSLLAKIKPEHRMLYTAPTVNFQPGAPDALDGLSPRARQIYADLKAAIAQQENKTDAHSD